MIERLYGDYYVSCDCCGRELDGTFFDFDDTKDSMKANGWKFHKIGDEWYHYCPECAPAMIRPGASEFSGLNYGKRKAKSEATPNGS